MSTQGCGTGAGDWIGYGLLVWVYEEKRSFEMPYDFYKKKKKTSYQENQAKNRRASFRTKTAKPVRRGPRRSI
jgi:hypothetical protein